MPANKNAADVSVTVFGGLCSEMAPSDLPQGASPLTYDTDFDIGRARTRDGLESVYSAVGLDALLLEAGPALQNFVELESGAGIILLEN
jgi:hypothetical protein